MSTRSRRFVERAGLVVSLLLGVGACDAADPTSWDRVRQSAEVIVARSPGGGTGVGGFGAVLLGYETSLPDPTNPLRRVRGSRFAVSQGADGPYSVFSAFDETILDQRATTGLYPTATPEPRFSGCVNGQFCGPGSSTSFAHTPMWRQDAATIRSACVIVPSGSAIVDTRLNDHHEQVQVRCEPSSTQIQPIDVPAELVQLGASAISLPFDHPLGAAIFGAPGDMTGNGSLWRLDDYPVNGLTRIDLRGTPTNAGIGRTMTSAMLEDGSVLVATGGRGRPDDPVVVVATIDPAGGATLRACLRGRGTHFGSSLVFGDFDADGLPDLVVGAGAWRAEDTSMLHTDTPLVVYGGDDLVAASAAGCEDPPVTSLAPARTIDCASDLRSGFTCATTTNDAYTGFGASLAVGDIDGDGHDDLVVGAPLSNVRASGAGVVVVLEGGTTFDAIGQGDHAVLSYASVGSGAHLGATVATVPGADRDEIVSGAPGVGHVALFYCSGLRGDRPEDFAGMAGVSHGCVHAPMSRPDVDAATMSFDAGMPSDAGSDAGDDASATDAGNDAGDDADVDAAVDGG